MKKLRILLLIIFVYNASFAQQAIEPYTCNARKQVPGSHKHGNQELQLLAGNDRSDTIDILNYRITLDITDFTAPDTIWGNTEVKFTPKMNNINTISLDLLQLTVDSIELSGNNLSFSYNDTLLIVALPVTHNIGDTSVITVYYRGVPQGDPSDWGGFYFQSGYAFNLGVGFAADPHNYGRVWFPCFDNFVERSTYEFNITTSNGKVAYCNGQLISDTTYANGKRLRRWMMNESIPTYLASVSVAAYTHVTQTFNGMNGAIPMWLTALPADTSNMKNSFLHLPDAMQAFENGYGPYMWNRVGFCLVPFSSGAMEHATNISYPRLAANGSLAYETLMAHELSHHWWGDLATCETQEDMWLNEGMATYSEFLFTEFVYGSAAYKNAVRSNHEGILHNAHLKEGGYRAVSGVPHQYTYGDHVYLKGADVAHTLRGYMGDSLFFAGLKAYLANRQFTHASSADFRNELTAATGVNLNDFFNDWVFNGGWPHFSVDSFSVVQNVPGSSVTVYLKQKITGAPAYFNNVPLEITYMDAQWNMHTETVMMSGPAASFTHSIPVINPVFVAVNLDEKISQAIAPEAKVLKAAGAHNFANARMNVTVESVTDSAFVLIEHNFAAPDSFKTPKPYRLSDYRYWKVSGLFPQGFDATARIYYDGRQNANYGSNYWLDHTLINASEDSLVLFYRKDASEDWNVFPWFTKFTLTNVIDKYGYVMIDSLLPGEYAFGMHDHTALGIKPAAARTEILRIYPNPANEEVTIEPGKMQGDGMIIIRDMTGKVIQVINAGESNSSITVNVSTFSNGIYLIEAGDRRGRFAVLR